jgi:hypothetical protein
MLLSINTSLVLATLAFDFILLHPDTTGLKGLRRDMLHWRCIRA